MPEPKKPLLVVNGKPYHYHEFEIKKDPPEEPDLEWQAHPMFRPVYRVLYPFHLTIKTYLAPGIRETSIWIVRRWRAESYSHETYSGARLKPTRKRERLIFENAVSAWPEIEHEIRTWSPPDSRPAWTLGNVPHCQYMEQAKSGYGTHQTITALCSRPAVYAIMWIPADFPGGFQVADHFGYICDYHKADFEACIKETQPNPEEYKLRRLHGGK